MNGEYKIIFDQIEKHYDQSRADLEKYYDQNREEHQMQVLNLT